MIWKKVKSGASLGRHTSWLIGGNAEYFVEPESISELKELYIEALSKNLVVTVLGGGTNVLINDLGVKGLVVSDSRLKGLELMDEKPVFRFWALCGTPKSDLLKIFLKQQLAPALFLAGLPGHAAGGVVMNAGVSEMLCPREFCEIVETVEVLRPNGNLEMVSGKKINWTYRHGAGWQPGIITRVMFSWSGDAIKDLPLEVKKLNLNRLGKQPLEYPSCGSVFRNPLPERAGQLIESCGLKGRRIGGAQISEKHANFIINLGDATASDVKSLIELCKSEVLNQKNIELKTEVVFLGF